jgi:putative ABC transport system permease protein
MFNTDQITLPINLAWRALFVSKVRTFLTVLGIVIGIAAVIIVMSAGESLKGLVLGQIEAFGSDFIQIEPKVPSTAKNSTENAFSMAQGIQVTTLKEEDAQAILRLPNITNYYAGVMGQAVVSFGGENKNTNFMGVSPSFIEIDQSEIASGRFFSESDNNDLARVAVLGSQIANKLFAGQNSVGQSVKIGKDKFRIVGVLRERGGGFGMDFDNLIYIPVATAQKLVMGIDHLLWITAQIKNTSIQDQTADDIIQLLRQRHDIADPQDDDFAVTTVAEAREMIGVVFGGITLLLIAIAGISLLVGGVGIMNIMYVSVTERTFEIGLRKSVGARPRQILWQFLWEAIAVTVFGGLIGITLGVGFTLIVFLAAKTFGFDWSFSLPPQSIIIAFGFCALVGLVFGYYPALKAAKLDPIEALRHE